MFKTITVNDIDLNKVALGIPLDGTDSATLNYIAHLSWTEAGDAIYKAAVILGLEVHPHYVAMRMANAKIDKHIDRHEEVINKLMLYPNPAYDKLLISGLLDEESEIEIYDAYSRVVYKKTNKGNSLIVDVAKFSSGIYNINIKNSSIKFATAKFAILK